MADAKPINAKTINPFIIRQFLNLSSELDYPMLSTMEYESVYPQLSTGELKVWSHP